MKMDKKQLASRLTRILIRHYQGFDFNHHWDVAEAILDYLESQEDSQENARLLSLLEQTTDCLEDIMTGKGGWAWEEVIQEAREIIKEVRR